MVISKYKDEQLTVTCPLCGTESVHDLSGWTSCPNVDFGGFENYTAICTLEDCGGAIAVNLDIPVLYDMDLWAMELLAPQNDQMVREVLRDLIWDKRADLQGIDREAYAQAYAEEHAEEIATIRNEISDTISGDVES